jgi:peroxiredoxin
MKFFNKRCFVGKRLFLVLIGVFVSAWALAGCGNSSGSNKPGGLSVGDKAADFALVDQDGKVMKLSDVQPGWYLMLIFYRGHWCGACQTQLLNLKQDFSKFAPLHTTMAAISVDPVADSSNFNGIWRFPFPLLSDGQLKLIDAYDLRHVQGHGGKDISRPALIIIDPQKTIRYKYVGKDPTDRPDDDEILFTLQKLQQSSKTN